MFKIAQFDWKATDRHQRIQRGKMLAKNSEAVEQVLLAKGYLPIFIRRNFILATKPKKSEVTQCLLQLSLLLNAAMPLKQSLHLILDGLENIPLFNWLNSVISQVDAGFPFSHALEKQAQYLSNQEIQLIKMAEKTGSLAKMLDNIVQTRLKSEKIFKKVKRVLFYPIFILVVSFLLSLAMLIFIVPSFAELYQGKEQSLPFITEVLFRLSQLLREHGVLWLIISLLIIGLLFGINQISDVLKKLKTKMIAHIPIFSQIIQQARIIYFTQNVALMLNAHIRLSLILTSFLSEKQTDKILEQEIHWMSRLLSQGYSFAEGLNPAVFTTQVVQMIAIGEKSGKLATMCEHVSEIYQQQLDHQIDMLSQMLEPMLMLIMGVIVGTIIIGLYLPIFDMGSLVG